MRSVPLPSALPLATLSEALQTRICSTASAGKEPGFRSAQRYRFDAPDASFETLYLARDFVTCFLETVVRDRPGLRIPRDEYDSRSCSLVLLNTRALNLVDLYGQAARLRLDASVLAGSDYSKTQVLAKSIHDHPTEPHGIVYRSRFDSASAAVVLFGRAKPLVRLFPKHKPVALTEVEEMSDAVRHVVPFDLI